MPIGARGHIGIKKETTWGEKVAGANDFFLPFISETLTADIEEVQSAAQRAVADEPVSYQGERAFTGEVVVEVHPASIGALLRSNTNEPAAATAAGTAETEIENCEDAWNEAEGVNAGVLSTIDSDDKKKGSASVRLSVSAGVGISVLATEYYAGGDMSASTHIKLWIKSSIAMDSGDLHFLLDDAAGCGGPLETLNIGALVAGVWTEVTLAIAVPASLVGVVSMGLKMSVDKVECIIHIDDVRKVTTTAAGNAKQHVFTPRQSTDFHADCPINPYTFEVYRDQGNAFQFLGGVVNTLALNFGTADKILKATCGIIAKNLGSVEKTNVGLEITNPFTWNLATIKIGGVAAENINNDIESFGITFDNACRGHYTCNQTVIPRKIIRDGYRTVPVNFVTEFTDQTEFDYFILGTERQFQVKFVGVACEAGYYYTLQIDLPKVKYTAYPINIGGPGRLTCAVNGKAKYDVNLGYSYLVTLINLQPSY